ncbi:M48 family metallopeptidase [Coralloluteibacterium thermophilus]|uniref:M48 family metallopeptidase n=1 Tax=Coralloluteibacterium thermophilum TaxID=2707049 RepID=A0ABV9NKG1_9GAMM
MNFFERQAIARAQSRRLVVLFALAVAAIVLTVDAMVFAALHQPGQPPMELAGTLVAVSAATLAVIGLASLFRISTLRQGGGRIAQEMGGVRVGEDVSDPDYRRLRNVVEEIAIASAVPVPEIYVLENEPGINAFAAGYAPTDAAVAVTRGALDRLNRDELQGVIAHEFSHILNGDMRLNIRLMGVLFGILVIALIGRRVLLYARGGRDSRGAAAILLAALAAMIVGYVGLFFGRLIKAGISRQREYLADASAVQFTRQTRGIAGALKKIGGLREGSRLADRAEGEEISHMLFGDGMGFSGLFATHPPLVKRIQAIEPHFKPENLEALAARWKQSPPSGREEDRALGLAPDAATVRMDGFSSTAATPAAVAAHVGEPDEADYAHAAGLLESIPVALADAAHAPGSAMPLLLGLLLDRDAAIRARQLDLVETHMGADAAAAVRGVAEGIDALHPIQRLPLAAMAFPALRRRPRPQVDAFLATVDALSHADGVVDLFEYCLGQMLRVQVTEALDPGAHWRPGRRRLAEVREEAVLLLAFLARAGTGHSIAAQRAFNAGVARLFPNEAIAYAAPAGGPQRLDPVWPALDALDARAKQVLVEALAATAGNDGRITVAEAELLRAVCALLHCPLPPLLEAR